MKLAPSQNRWLTCATLCILLAATIALLIDLLLLQWRPVLDSNWTEASLPLSARSRATLTDTAGTIAIVSLLPAESPATLPAGHLLRRFDHASRELSGAILEITYADPRTEPQFTAQMMAAGAEGPGILLRQMGRNVFIPEQALLSENGTYDPANAEEALAAAFARLSRADGVQIGWLTGHGEASLANPDPAEGYSGLRRALENEGCILRDLRLDANAAGLSIPPEIKVIAIVNPRYPITPTERIQLAEWLDRGGRLICFLPSGETSGLAPLLELWGLRIGTTPRIGTVTTPAGLSRTDLLDEAHPITEALAGNVSVNCCAPKALYPFDVRGINATALLRLTVHPLAEDTTTSGSEQIIVGLAAERGSNVGEDLGFKPGRIVIFGDASFASNRNVLNRASANRDLTINAFRWLTGLSGSGARGAFYGLSIGWDRQMWKYCLVILGVGIPLLFGLLIKLLTWRMA